ncbi:MAG: hypothetical protein Q4F13_08010 [Pseudomonadota bacterium]|nr:hypothetical protein [Pseudomonadota bacterium]
MPTPAADSRLPWAAAVALALGLHAAVLWGLRHLPAPATHTDAARLPPPPMTWHVRVASPPAPAATPAVTPPAPQWAPPPPPSRATARAARPQPAPARPPESPPKPPPEPPPAPLPEPLPEPAVAAPPPPPVPPRLASSEPMQWLDANSADTAPAPEHGEWTLADTPWPASHPSVKVRLWVNSRGRIERFELQGPAADDPALQQLFARLAHTPMLAARIGRVPVPSTVLVQIWAPEGGQPPNYVMPLPSRE